MIHHHDKYDDSTLQVPYWPHSPIHRLAESGTYFVTARTYQKLHHFTGSERLAVLHRGLLKQAHKFGWQLEAWAVFSNHYHFVAHSPPQDKDAETLKIMLRELHSLTARWINKLDNTPGRQIWHNYRETKLTYMSSYLARLKYTHQNPVRHKLVDIATSYPWCSAAWFKRTASPAQVQTVNKLKLDSVAVEDDFVPAPDW